VRWPWQRDIDDPSLNGARLESPEAREAREARRESEAKLDEAHNAVRHSEQVRRAANRLADDLTQAMRRRTARG